MSEATGGILSIIIGKCPKCEFIHHQDYAYCDGRRKERTIIEKIKCLTPDQLVDDTHVNDPEPDRITGSDVLDTKKYTDSTH